MVARHACSSSSSASFLELEQLLLSSFTISCTGNLSSTLSAQNFAMAFSCSIPSESCATSWITVSRSLPSTYVPLVVVSSYSCSCSNDLVLDRRLVTLRLSAKGHSAIAAGPTSRLKNSREAVLREEDSHPHTTT
ncbi:hypothetical protein GUJ93_ZPchr0001g31138 [Zizania palustris]|uniref:Uncharacterized protein n=1 Tax=Zizania palustris TaxID=103762 RepID=A0A8J5R6Q5_ZIZPA|nr:hypothetical protein GUJ93_ZPchr0001g31138 [Zizania palustris]